MQLQYQVGMVAPALTHHFPVLWIFFTAFSVNDVCSSVVSSVATVLDLSISLSRQQHPR